MKKNNHKEKGSKEKINKEKSSNKVCNTIYNVLIGIFLVLFIWFPYFIVLENTTFWFFTTFIILFTLIFINWKKINFLENKKTIYFIILLTFLSRLIFVIKINDNIMQVSDFKYVFDMAKKFEFNAGFFQTAYHYFLYTYINGLLYKVFGGYQIVTLIFNSIIVSSISLVLYKICQIAFKNNKIGNMAAILYLCWPSTIIYTCIMTPDHLSMFFMLISVYLICKILDKKEDKISKKSILFMILAGLSISMIGFFKNFAPVVIIALLIIFGLICIKNIKYLKYSLIAFTIILASYAVTSFSIFSFEESFLGVKIMKNQLGAYVYVGLGYENNGYYSAERYGEYHDYLIAHNMDVKATNKYFMKKLKNEFKYYWSSYPKLLTTKQIYSFGTDDAQGGWVVASLQAKNEIYNRHMITILSEPFRNINEIFYIILVLFTIIACIYNVVYDKNNSLLFISIVMFGCCLMLMLAESQGRYKYTFEPLYCVMAAYGIYNGYQLLKNLLTRKIEDEK